MVPELKWLYGHLVIWVYKTFICPCYYEIYAMIVRGSTKPKRKLNPVKFYLTNEEFAEVWKRVILMYEHKVIPRPTIGAFAKVAVYKFYNKINQIAIAKGKLSTTSQEENRDTIN
jgi:hypothetical protein